MRFILSVLGVLAVLAGCGYTTRTAAYEESTIIIKPVVNQINIAQEERKYSDYKSFPRLIENTLTSKLVSEFNIDGQLKVVRDDPRALVLTSAVTNYNKESLRYTDSEDIKEQRLRLYVSIKLTDAKGEVIKEKEVVGEAAYFLSGANQKSESAAQIDLIDDTARRICEAVVENW